MSTVLWGVVRLWHAYVLDPHPTISRMLGSELLGAAFFWLGAGPGAREDRQPSLCACVVRELRRRRGRA